MEKLNKDDKWILVSCLQKSIRKGFDDLSGMYASKLCEIGEKNYLAYRLSIMAVEDIGIAGINDITPFLNTRIKKSEIEKNGGEEYLIETAKRFSLLKKDRTACDLVSLIQVYHPEELDIEQHKELFLDSSQHEITRALSAWMILGGKKHKNNLIQSDKDNLEDFMLVNEKLLSSSPNRNKILSIIEDSYLVHREPHFIVIGLLQNIFDNEYGMEMKGFKTGDFLSNKFSKTLLQDYFLMDGVDIHTTQGKTAAYQFLKRPSLINEWMSKNEVKFEDKFNVIKCLSFRTVGQKVDERLFYPTAVRVTRDIQKETLNRYVGHDVNYQEAMQSFSASLPIWNNCVKDVIDKKYGIPNSKFFPF